MRTHRSLPSASLTDFLAVSAWFTTFLAGGYFVFARPVLNHWIF